MKKYTTLFWVFASLLLASCGSMHGKVADTAAGRVPDTRDVTIYQVNIRTFSEQGNLQGVLPRLDSIKALGANLIYLMPIYPVGKVKGVNSPYCVQDYTAVNPEFGSLADLKAVVKKAHELGLSVILDWVPNHTAYDHAWTKNKSWYLQDSVGNIVCPPGTGWVDVAQLNFDNMDMRREMIKSMQYWLKAADVDGFRCDFSDGPPFSFWKEAVKEVRGAVKRPLIMLSEGTREDQFTAGFDFNFGFRFFENMKDIFEHGRSVSFMDSLNVNAYMGANDKQLMVVYTTNHDVNSSDGTPEELFGGHRGAMAAFVAMAYMKGVPMIYTGQEVGTPERMLFPFVEKNIDWSLNPDYTQEYKKIIGFRNSSEAIRRGKLTSYTTDDVCAFTKTTGKETVAVLINLRDKEIAFDVPAKLINTQWKDAYTGSDLKLEKKIKLPPFSYLVLK